MRIITEITKIRKITRIRKITCSFNFKSPCWNSGLLSLMPSYLIRLIHSVFQKRKSIGDWLAGCRNALPAIVCHAILRLKNAVENQLLMVQLDVRASQAAGTWGSFSNYVTLWVGGRPCATLSYIGGRQCQCCVLDRWCASFLRHTRFAHAPCVHCERASRVRVLCIIL